jgi:hypothetical protein
MANRYWVGGAGSWSDTDRWATSTGGEGGVSVPSSSDDVFIDANSGFGSGGTITLDVNGSCHDFICSSGHTISLSSSAKYLDTYGDLTLEPGITVSDWRFRLNGSEDADIDWAGASANISIYMNGTGRKYLQSNLPTGVQFYDTGGVFDANDFNVGNPTSGNSFNCYPDSGETYTIYMGSGTWYLGFEVYFTGLWYGGTVNLYCETSTMVTKGSYCSFFGGENEFYNFVWGETTDDLTIGGSATFNNFTEEETDNYHIVRLYPTTTLTINGSFGLGGTEADLTVIANAVRVDTSKLNYSIQIGTASGIIIWQQLTFTEDTTLFRIYSYLRRTGSTTDYSIKCSIYSDDSDAPDELIEACTSNISSSTVSTSGSHCSFEFDDVSLSATKYWLKFEQVGGTLSNSHYCSIGLRGQDIDTYTGGEAYYQEGAGALTIINPLIPEDYCDLAIEINPQHTLSKSSGTIECDYLDISNSNATGGALWYAGSHSLDTKNNSGWHFEPVNIRVDVITRNAGVTLSPCEVNINTIIGTEVLVGKSEIRTAEIETVVNIFENIIVTSSFREISVSVEIKDIWIWGESTTLGVEIGTESGVCYRSESVEITEAGTYEFDIDGLELGKTYYLKAFVDNIYSDEIFTNTLNSLYSIKIGTYGS